MRPYILLIILFLPLLNYGQRFTTTIKGKVTDKDSRQPVAGVNVMVLHSDPPIGATTNEEGDFKIEKVDVGHRSLRFTFVGYEDVVVNELLLTSGKETYLNIELQEKVTDLKEVVISSQQSKAKGNNDFAAVSVLSFSADEMSRYAGTLNDPARMAQSFAGVMTANDENNQIVVRGNSPRGLLWRMEGIEIPNPNHFAGSEGSTGGGVSILSANMLTRTDFLSGAFPAEYGNALSGVFDLNLRKGNSEKWEFTLQAGILGLEAALEGPFSKKYKGSYLINYRYSTLDILSLMGLKIGGNVLPKYQDLAFNFNFPSKKIGSFTLFGIGGMSSLGEQAKRDTSAWQTLSDKSEFNQAQMMGVLGATHLLLLKDNKTYIKTILSYSYTNHADTEDTLSNSFDKFNLSNEKFIYRTLRANVTLNSKLNPRNNIRSGFTYSHINYRLFSEAYSYYLQKNETQVNHSGFTDMYQAYVEWKHRFTERLQLNSGVHFLFSVLNNKFYIEPRINAEWRVKENQTLSFGTGIHSRMDAVSTYVSYETPNARSKYPNMKLDFSRAFHLVAGYNFAFLKDFNLKVEAYFQYLFSVPIGMDSANGTFSILNYDDGFVNMPLQSTGKGYNYGLELTLEKFFSKNYFFMLTASVFDSRYAGSDGVWRNTAYNVNYVMNALGGKEFVVGKKKNNIIGITAKIIWRGGQRYTPVDLAESMAENETVYDNSQAFSKKLPDYFRIDFGANFRRNKKKYSWVFSFDAQNLINRQNVAREVYDPEKQQVTFARNLGIVPVLSWKVMFGI